VALPTVGALVAGWLLIVPRSPLLAFADTPNRCLAELESFLNEVAAGVATHYGSVALFEHGAAATGNPIGCGVDYAHLHIVPTECDLLAGAQKLAPQISWSRIGSMRHLRERVRSGNGYWLIQQPYGSGDIHVGQCDGPQPSQLFRRVLGEHLGCSERFNWRVYSGAELIAATVNTLTSMSPLHDL
jgi:ATP adenylyltransferase